jgi:hypothetical protein
MQESEIRPLPLTIYKNQVKGNQRHKTMKLLEENMGKTLQDIEIGKDYLDKTSNA